MKRLQLIALLLCLPSTGCLIAPDAAPSVDFRADALTKYVFRGVPLSDDGALQGSVNVALPTKDGNSVSLEVFGNMNLSNSNNGGVFGDNNGFEFTRVDTTVAYSRPLREDIQFTGGLTHYTFPGQPNAMLGILGFNYLSEPTTALFASATFDRWDLAPTVTLFWDFDEAQGLYLTGGVSREFEIDDKMFVEVGTSLGLSSDGHSDYYYGENSTGLADLTAHATLFYQFDASTTLNATVGGSTLIDSNLDDTLDAANIDTDNLWLGVGAMWSF